MWRLLYPRVERLGFLKQKGKEKKRAEPKTRIGSVSCPVASSPDPNVRLKFEKPALDRPSDSSVKLIGVVNEPVAAFLSCRLAAFLSCRLYGRIKFSQQPMPDR